VPPEKIRIMFT